jgi:hypothetical protein
MYIDARTGITTDVKSIIGLKRGERAWAKAGMHISSIHE